MTRAMTSEALPPLLENPDPKTLATEVLMALKYRVGKDTTVATQYDWLTASIKVVRDRIVDRWMQATKEAYDQQEKRVYYLSLEFLIGRLMRDAFSNLGLMDNMRDALSSLGVDLDLIAALEPDAALGNGGLGRLAACFMESMATLDIPAHGYGIRYDHGMFRQEIHDGWQVELPENWLDHRQSLGIRAARRSSTRSASAARSSRDLEGRPTRAPCLAAGRDASRRSPTTRRRRLARPTVSTRCGCGRRAPVDPMRLDAFNRGDHVGALAESSKAEAISRVLYPSDYTPAGQELRLRQEYFFASASLQDIVQRHLSQYGDLQSLPDKVAIQLNDTHPAHRRRRADAPAGRRARHALGRGLGRSPSALLGYTNHTLLPEALESWPVPLFERLLPRHMQIIYPINADAS